MEKSQTQFLTGVLEQIRALKRQAERLESQVAAYLEDMDMAENAGTDDLFAATADEDLPEAETEEMESDDLPEMPEMEIPEDHEDTVKQPEADEAGKTVETAKPEESAEHVETAKPAENAEPVGEAPVFDIELDDDIEIVPIGEAHAATGAVMDKMAEKESWRTDMPGSSVSDIRSAISLNDRILFINTLFHEDPIAFKEALSELNTMPSFEDGVKFILKLHPEWNTESEVVYRFMMAVRRKLK